MLANSNASTAKNPFQRWVNGMITFPPNCQHKCNGTICFLGMELLLENPLHSALILKHLKEDHFVSANVGKSTSRRNPHPLFSSRPCAKNSCTSPMSHRNLVDPFSTRINTTKRIGRGRPSHDHHNHHTLHSLPRPTATTTATTPSIHHTLHSPLRPTTSVFNHHCDQPLLCPTTNSDANRDRNHPCLNKRRPKR